MIAIGLYSIFFYYESNGFILVLLSIVVGSLFFWPIKPFKTIIYSDIIVFKEFLRHPNLKNESGIAFENIYDYKISSMVFNLKWIVIKRRNGKTIRKMLSFSASEFKEFSNLLKEKVIRQ